MTLTSTQKYYLARFLSDKYDVNLETVEQYIKDPEIEKWEDFNFVDERLHFGNREVKAEFDPEFLEREQEFNELVWSYLRRNPDKRDNYLDLIQITPEKETELAYNNPRWYTEDQLPQIKEQLDEKLTWLEENVSINNFPSDFEAVYRYNLALLRYGLEKAKSSWVDFLNPHNTFKSKLHTNGAIRASDEEFYLSSLHSRLDQVFDVSSEESMEDKIDLVVELLVEHYTGKTRELVQTTELILQTELD